MLDVLLYGQCLENGGGEREREKGREREVVDAEQWITVIVMEKGWIRYGTVWMQIWIHNISGGSEQKTAGEERTSIKKKKGNVGVRPPYPTTNPSVVARSTENLLPE